MMSLRILTLCAGLSLTGAFAQEGHPLVGTWHGSWADGTGKRSDVTVVITWDGVRIGGMINPGPGSGTIEKATLDPESWKVHLESDAKDALAKPVHVVVEGRIENITNLRRSLTGKWKQGAQEGDFKLVRDN
jgi:hypothetical protein